MTAVEHPLASTGPPSEVEHVPGDRVPISASELVGGDPFARVRAVLVVAYVIGYVVWFFKEGLLIDRISVSISVVVLLVVANVGRPAHRWLTLGRDVVLYAAMWLVYEESRGIADHVGMPLQVESVRNIDRALLFGHDASVVLQRHFYEPKHVRWYDVVGSLVYMTHFWLPIAVIVTLWIRDHRQWVRFMRRFATVLFAACAMFVVVPTAPPWMAAGGDRNIKLDALEPVARITWRGWQQLGLHGFVHAWHTGRDWLNTVAAMPSLHAGFAMFVVVFALPWVRPAWARVVLFAFPLTMALSLAYFGEHYLADALAGWTLVGLSFLCWNRIERARRRRRITDSRLALGTVSP